MRHSLLLFFAGLIVSLTSCRNDFEFEPSSGNLEFSRDTVYLDTVFTNIGSSTYMLKVYNRSKKDIAIPSIRLKKPDSKYRLMVDGMSGTSFTDVELLAKDSMFIFIETTVDVAEANPDDFLYTDEIEFSSTNGVQEVHLVTLIQDAYFLYPQRNDEGLYEGVRYDSETNPDSEAVYIYGFNLDHSDVNNGDEYHWNNTKPYVIYGFATVPNGETLVIDPGARVHFHANSGLMVRPGAKLEINGTASSDPETAENEVIFEGDRLEPGFANIPGQWFGVLLMSAEDNAINHLTLKNAEIGILASAPIGDEVTKPKLSINNSQIYNHRNFGILGVNADIIAANLAANIAGQASVACTLGGNYSFKHCTFANYFNHPSQVPLLVNDYQLDGEVLRLSSLNATFENCIMYGSSSLGISLENAGADTPEVTFNCTFSNSLIKFVDFSNRFANHPLYQFNGDGIVNYNNVLIAESSIANTADFVNPQRNNLNILNTSAAIGIGSTTVAAQVPADLNNVSRTANPDAGAYQHLNE
jgi:hypothetical protein